MPIMQGYTSEDGERVGYYQYGDGGKKYHYTVGDAESRADALEKAKEQAQAIEASRS